MPATPDVRVNNCVIRFESTGDPGRVVLPHVCGAHADKCAFYGRADHLVLQGQPQYANRCTYFKAGACVSRAAQEEMLATAFVMLSRWFQGAQEPEVVPGPVEVVPEPQSPTGSL